MVGNLKLYDHGQGWLPKKLDSIWCPQCRESKADTFKQLRPIGEGDKELEKRLVQEELTQKVTNMHRKSMQVKSLIATLTSTSKNPWSFLLLLILSLQQN
jgi:hypothetical protein